MEPQVIIPVSHWANASRKYTVGAFFPIDLLTCVEERSVIGGPSSSSVKMQIEILEKFIKENKENLSCLK